jgi:hypothetical protein
MSRQELAEMVNAYLWQNGGDPDTALDETDIGRLERGDHRWPGRLRREAFRAVLHAATDADLGFYINRRARTGSAQVAPGRATTEAEEMIIVDVVIDGRAMAAQVSRRTLFEAFASGLAAPMVSRTIGGHGHVDPAIVDHFAALRVLLVESDNRFGPASVLSTVRQQLGLIAGARRQTNGTLHRALLSAQARWAEFAGWLCDDLGQYPEGGWWLSQALSIAVEADDTDFTAYVLTRSAQRTASTPDHDRVLGLAQAAARTGTPHRRVLAFAALQRAHGHAIAGDAHQFEAAVHDARTLVDSGEAAADGLGSFCTAPYFDAQEAEGWLLLGKPATAAHCFGQALERWPAAFERDRGISMSRAAAAYLADRKPDESATTALAAFMLAEKTQSMRIKQQVIAVGRQLTSYRSRPSVAALLEALAAKPSKAST